jgi:hypothetical protein
MPEWFATPLQAAAWVGAFLAATWLPLIWYGRRRFPEDDDKRGLVLMFGWLCGPFAVPYAAMALRQAEDLCPDDDEGFVDVVHAWAYWPVPLPFAWAWGERAARRSRRRRGLEFAP